MFFLTNKTRGRGLEAAKKFHGDFPAFASDKAWTNKILVSIAVGALALAAAFTIYQGYGKKLSFLVCSQEVCYFYVLYKQSYMVRNTCRH